MTLDFNKLHQFEKDWDCKLTITCDCERHDVIIHIWMNYWESHGVRGVIYKEDSIPDYPKLFDDLRRVSLA